MRRFITTEAKRRAIDKAWREYNKAKQRAWTLAIGAGMVAANERADIVRRWIEDAVALADRGEDLPPLPKHGEDYDP